MSAGGHENKSRVQYIVFAYCCIIWYYSHKQKLQRFGFGGYSWAIVGLKYSPGYLEGHLLVLIPDSRYIYWI